MTAADTQRSRKFRIKRGLTLPITGAPEQRIEDAAEVKSVALLGRDYPGIRAELLVAEGDSVSLGQPLFRDRRRPEVRFTSPGTGRVAAIHRGARRALQAVVVTLEDKNPVARKYEALAPLAGYPCLLSTSGCMTPDCGTPSERGLTPGYRILAARPARFL